MSKKKRRPKREVNDGVKQPRGDVSYLFFDPEEIAVAPWFPTPDASGDPTQVHIIISPDQKENFTIVLRFKGPDSLGEIIHALMTYRNDIWPDADRPWEEDDDSEKS